MKVDSRIFCYSASDFKPGNCSVCGHCVEIRFRDTSTDAQFGSCCIAFAIMADKVICHRTGMRHPEPEEVSSIPNN